MRADARVVIGSIALDLDRFNVGWLAIDYLRIFDGYIDWLISSL